MALSLHIAESFDALDNPALSLLSGQASPFLDAHWFECFTNYVAPAIGTQQWLCLQEQDRAQAVLPLLSQRSQKNPALLAMSNYYSPEFAVLTDKTNPMAAMEAMQQLIAIAAPHLSEYSQVTLSPLSEERTANLERAFRENGWLTHRYAFSGNWREDQVRSFNTYWQNRPSRLKNSVKRKSQKLPQKGTRFELLTNSVSDQQLFDFHRVYRASWKPKEPYPAFIDALIRSLAERHELRMGILYVEGVPVAAQVWAQRGDTAYVYKLAYRDDRRDLSPGTLLSHRMFEWVIDEHGATSIDYLTGDDAYKQSWVSTRVPLYGLECCNRSHIAGWARHARNSMSAMRRSRG